jgi:hypothetical protein
MVINHVLVSDPSADEMHKTNCYLLPLQVLIQVTFKHILINLASFAIINKKFNLNPPVCRSK